MIEAVVFDLDGVLLDSEQVWDEAREQLAEERGGRWHDQAQKDMMGMSSTEWSRYMHERIGLPEPPEEINREVVERLAAIYREHLPAIAGAREAVERLAARWPLGLASSSNRELIDLTLELLGVKQLFAATVSSEEVARGKPAPDVYLEAARRLEVDPAQRGGGRGLEQRHPRRQGRRDARAGDPEPSLPARRGSARAGGRRAGLAGGADRRSGRAPLANREPYRRSNCKKAAERSELAGCAGACRRKSSVAVELDTPAVENR